MSLYYSILNSCCTVGKRNSRVRIDEDAHAGMWTSVENRKRGYGCVVGTDRRGHKSRMRVERCNRFKAFLPEALHEVVGIAEPLFIHFSVPSWASHATAPLIIAGEGARATHFEARFEEIFDFRQDLGCAFRFVDRFAQGCSSGHAMREPGGELLHLAFRSWHFFFDEHLEIGADHFVAIGFGRLIVKLGMLRRF